MINAHVATVTSVVSIDGHRRGVLVAYRDGTVLSGEDGVYVRVGQRRAHAHGGAVSDFPQPGEMGVVLEVDESNFVWICSLDPAENQTPDPENMAFWRHESGVRRWTNQAGETGFQHPSGLKAWIGAADAPPAAPAGSSKPKEVVTDQVTVGIQHPKAGTVLLKKDGSITLDHPSGAAVHLSAAGEITFSGMAFTHFQDANARFCMEALFTWAQSHTHTSSSPGSPTSAPIIAPPADGLSPTTFKGPHA